MLLLEKYKPKYQKDLLINPGSCLLDIKNWLTSLDKNPKQILCIIGPISCGKTICIDILLKNFNKFNIDIDSTKQNDLIDSLINYKDQTFHSVSDSKNIIVIDNVEQSEKQVLQFIDKVYNQKKLNTPIILISNNLKSNEQFKESSFLSLFSFVNIGNPNEKDIINLITKISKNENLNLQLKDIHQIIKKSENDFRQMFSILDSWVVQLKVNSKSNFDHFDLQITSKFKDIDLIEKIEYFVNNQNFDFDKSFLMSSSEAYPISLGIYQNYLNQTGINCDSLNIISDTLSHSNIINNQIYNHQCWELYDDYSVSACVIPSYLIKQNKLENIEVKQFKDISYNFENSLNELKSLLHQNNYDNKIFKSDCPNNIFTNIDTNSMFIIINNLINAIEIVNNSLDKLKKGKNTSKKEKLEMAKNIKEAMVIKSFTFLLDTLFHYRLFELDWQYLRLNITELQDEEKMIDYFEKIDLRIFKRLINIFSLSKTNKLLKSHTETALKFNLCKKIIEKMIELNLHTIVQNNIEDLTQSIDEIWKF